MTATPLPRAARRTLYRVCWLAAALHAAPAIAADKPAASAPQNRAGAASASSSAYEKERAACLSGQSQQDRETCLREANNARADAKQGGLDDKGAPYGDNASQRCAALSGDDKTACLARMKGEGTTSGDVRSGGIVRERVERGIPASAAASAGSGKAPAPAPVPSK